MKKLLVVFVLAMAACGGGEVADTVDSATNDTPTTAAASDAVEETQPPAADAAEEPATTDAPAEEPAASTPGGIVLTIGADTWEFEGAFCAYIGPAPGNDGSEWNVSYLQDGGQVYIADDEFGKLASWADISNGGNPTFNWEAMNDDVTLSVDGNDITGEATFTDQTGANPPAEGTVTATCADWFEG